MFLRIFIFNIALLIKFKVHGQLIQCNTQNDFTEVGQQFFIQWPDETNPTTTCEYVIKSPVDTFIGVQMAYNLIGSNTSCTDQFIKVASDGNPSYFNAPLYCGHRDMSDPLLFKSAANELRILIQSNDYSRSVQIILESIALTQSTCSCGISNAPRIANGYSTNYLEFTAHVGFKAVISGFDECFCGGTIISQYHVLTAAHCVTEIQKFGIDAVKMHVGHQNINIDIAEDTPYSEAYNIYNAFSHENYNAETNANDIGFVIPSTYIKINRGVWPVCIPFAWRNFNLPSGNTMIAVGFGSTEFSKDAKYDEKSWILQSVHLQVDSTLSPCDEDTTKICAQGTLDGDSRGDSCQRDSGGGFYGMINNLYHIFGITSQGFTCGLRDSYSINTNVLNYISWIEQIVGDILLCQK